MATTSPTFNQQTLIPDLLKRAPQARAVLDRYGLRGCGGENGPHESLEFFARAHEVPLERLLEEIRRAAAAPLVSIGGAPPAPSLADTIYRPFFLAGIATVLTLGAAWGAYLLLRIGLGGTFQAAGLHEINAHGHAQIFGWVGLFVMGFAYQAFPRFKHTTLRWPRLALATFLMLLVGLVARSVAHPLVATMPALWWVAVVGSILEVVAIALFAGIITKTLLGSGQRLAAYDYYILAALGWFVVQAVYEGIYLTATLAASGSALLQLVATWQPPLREIQIHGFALLMILGVSQRAFHHFYGLPAPSAKLSLWLLPVFNLAVIGEVVGLLFIRQEPRAAFLWYGSAMILTIATAALVINWRIDKPAPDGDRTLKFLRAAYVWLFISLGMLVLLPAHQAVVAWIAPASAAAEAGFSHAYYGAARHAITVGFVSLMILGVSSKVVPTLNGVDGRSLSQLMLPFVLINLGCAIRVVGQTLTDFTPIAYPVAGISGLLELTGLGLWGGHLCLIMAGRVRRVSAAPLAQPPLAGRPIQAADTVAAVLDDAPLLLETFVAAGFKQLASPYARQTMARVVTLRQACQRTGRDCEAFVAALNEHRDQLRLQQLPQVLPIVNLSQNEHCHVT